LGDSANGALLAAEHLSDAPQVRLHFDPRLFVVEQRSEL
jgi:hypothetical protein